MIRNGVIDAKKEFAERRYYAGTYRTFEKLKAKTFEDHGIDIECCRRIWVKAQERIFAVVGDMLVNTLETPTIVENWEGYKLRNGISD